MPTTDLWADFRFSQRAPKWRSSIVVGCLFGAAAVFVDAHWGQYAAASDWARFRGPNGSGVSPDTVAAPEVWSPSEHIRWKTPLPGAGVSCPIVVGDRVFVTCYSGYGMDLDDTGEPEQLRRHLVCVHRADGRLLWQRDVDPVLPEDQYSGMGVPQHGYASHTPTSDGQSVYVFFGKSGVRAYNLDGESLWQASVGTDSDPHRWGSAASPIVHDGILIVPAGAESRALVGLDAKTGEERWRADSEDLGNVWGTPALVAVDQDRVDLVLGAPYELWGFNPHSGKLRWYCEAMETDSFNSSVVIGDGVAYAVEGRGGGSIAVKVDGKGDITATNVVWSGRDTNRFGSPLYLDGRLYFVSGGIVNCLDALTGVSVYQSRLPRNADSEPVAERPGGRGGRGGRGFGGNTDYSSPVAADGKIYYVTRSGVTHVFRAGDTFQPVSANRLTDDAETFSATPAISDGELFIRSDKHLYCVAK